MRGVAEPMKDPSNARFFREIEELSKALDVDAKRLPRRGRAPALPGSRSASAGRYLAPSDSRPKEKKPSSLWNWKPLKALSHIRHRRFECVFSLRVHSIENVPLSLADASLCVNWRRNTADAGLVHSRPARVFRGVAVFQDTLTYNCSVYGSRSGPQGTAKYEARHFLLYATVLGAPGLDLGKHRVDLTRLLPVNLEELEEETSCGSWSTSFRLSGKASGATLNVSFGFSVVGGNDKVQNSGGFGKMPEILAEKGDRMNAIRRTDSLPELKSQLVDEAFLEIKETSGNVISREVPSRVEENVMEAQNDSPEMKCCLLPEPCFRDAKESDCFENSVIEQSIEIYKEDVTNLSVIKMLNSEKVILQDCSEAEVTNRAINQMQYESSFSGLDMKEMDFLLGESSAKELDSTIHPILCHEFTEMRNPEQKIEIPEKVTFDGVGQFEERGSLKMRSQSLDDLTEEVANEFLSMLDLEHNSTRLSSEGDPESPKEQLWKQFEMDSIISNDGLFILEMGADQEMKWGNTGSEVFDLSAMVHDASSSNQEPVQTMECKSMAQMLEDAETEALLCEWGLDETVFEGPPPDNRGGFGSPIHLLPEETTVLPPLGENLGPFVQTKDGGFLRSMSPSLFKGSKSNGKLIMQVSKPVVMPAEMGSDVMGILKHLASVGVEKLSTQAGQLMPLEEITGSSMQQLAWEASPYQSGHDSPLQPNREDELGYDLNTFGKKCKPFTPVSERRRRESNNEYVSLEDLAPLAMDKIEALSIEGLKIQSGMSDEELPSNTTKQFVGEMPTLEEKGVQNLISLGVEGAVGLQLLDVKGNGGEVDGLMSLSITLDEWMQLDMGILDEEDELSDRTSKILAAHHAKPAEFSGGGLKGNKRGKKPRRRWGLLENNFTVALMVQLRDPFRDYEPVGMPMLALVQVERVFVPPKPKIYCMVSDKGSVGQEIEPDAEVEPVLMPENDRVVDVIPQFKVTDVHVAGLKADTGKKGLGGSSIQQQSGSRWLVANGMGKQNKYSFSKSNTCHQKISQWTTKDQPKETLWSISSLFRRNDSKSKEAASSKSHMRNPNIWFL